MPDVAVIFGGPSPEHDVSVLTGLQAARGLAGAPGPTGATPTLRALFWSKTGEWFEVDPSLEAEAFVEGVPKGATRLQLSPRPTAASPSPAGRLGKARTLDLDAALVCCHGGPGEDGTLQAALDLAGIRYSGPHRGRARPWAWTSWPSGPWWPSAGLPTLPRALLTAQGSRPPSRGPTSSSPASAGRPSASTWWRTRPRPRPGSGPTPTCGFGAVVEPYRPDLTDLQVAVRSWPELQLSAIERPIRTSGAADILDYRDKYVAGEGMAGANRELPARIPAELEKALRQAAETVAGLTGLRGVARIDFLSDGQDFVVNEVNTIPGSLARYLWVDPAVPLVTLLHDLLEEARRRPTHAYSAAGADGTVLRSAGSIAGKLG